MTGSFFNGKIYCSELSSLSVIIPIFLYASPISIRLVKVVFPNTLSAELLVASIIDDSIPLIVVAGIARLLFNI